MYQRLTLVPTGFPLIDDLRIALLTQQEVNHRRTLVNGAVCTFVGQKLQSRGIIAKETNIQFLKTDRHGKTTVCYQGGTFDIHIDVTVTKEGTVLEVVGVSHLNLFLTGLVAQVGERAIYAEVQNG